MSESCIDTERMMKGEDIGKPTWTRCSEQMPPHDDDLEGCVTVIAKAHDMHNGDPFLTDTWTMHNSTIDWTEWCEYTKETWEALTNGSDAKNPQE